MSPIIHGQYTSNKTTCRHGIHFMMIRIQSRNLKKKRRTDNVFCILPIRHQCHSTFLEVSFLIITIRTPEDIASWMKWHGTTCDTGTNFLKDCFHRKGRLDGTSMPSEKWRVYQCRYIEESR